MEFPSYFKHSRTPTPESNVPTLISETRGLKTLARKIPSQRWEFNFNGFTYNDSCNAGFNESTRFFGEFVAPSENGFGVFDYKPNDEFLMGAIGAQVYDSANAKLTLIRISIDINTPDPDNVVIPGKMLKFSTGDKVYMITESTRASTIGNKITYYIRLNTGLQQPQPAFTNIISDSNLRIKLRTDGAIGRGTTSNLKRNKTVYQFRMVEVI